MYGPTAITVSLAPAAQGMTPATIGEALAAALAFGTDDVLDTYADPFWNADPTVLALMVGDARIGTVTLGPR